MLGSKKGLPEPEIGLIIFFTLLITVLIFFWVMKNSKKRIEKEITNLVGDDIWVLRGVNKEIFDEMWELENWSKVYSSSKCKNCICDKCDNCIVFKRIDYLKKHYCEKCGYPKTSSEECQECPHLVKKGKINLLKDKIKKIENYCGACLEKDDKSKSNCFHEMYSVFTCDGQKNLRRYSKHIDSLKASICKDRIKRSEVTHEK